jgi:hypothetical protein
MARNESKVRMNPLPTTDEEVEGRAKRTNSSPTIQSHCESE